MHSQKQSSTLTELQSAPPLSAASATPEKLLEAIRRGDVSYDFVEVMACPGGCVGGGGQPICDGKELAGVRGENLHFLDKNSKIRFSHENQDVAKLYQDFLRTSSFPQVPYDLTHGPQCLVHARRNHNFVAKSLTFYYPSILPKEIAATVFAVAAFLL